MGVACYFQQIRKLRARECLAFFNFGLNELVRFVGYSDALNKGLNRLHLPNLEKSMTQATQTRHDPLPSVAEPGNTEWPALSAAASLISLEEGLYVLAIGESAGCEEEVRGLKVPVIQVSALPEAGEQGIEILGVSGGRETSLGKEGGTVIVKAPHGGGHVLVTAYTAPAQRAAVAEVDIQRLDRPRSNGVALGTSERSEEPEEVQTEIALHIERHGDRRFPGQGWVGNRGKRLRIEAFSIRPLERLTARDIEFKALGPNRQQTPWVSDAKLCGTRGQGIPLTGFALRLAPPAAQRFDILYSGAFFDSGTVGPCRNGELCIPPIADDPLEAIKVQVIRRGTD
jgi:hypothetical protein